MADLSKVHVAGGWRGARAGWLGSATVLSARAASHRATLRGLGIVACMAVKLHRCSTRWKFGPCWRVQKALDEQGIAYEVVKGPARPGKRADLQRLSRQ